MALCRRAGKLVMGFDAVVQEITRPKSKAAGIVLAADVSPKTRKEIEFQTQKYQVEIVQAGFSMDEAKNSFGKRCGVFLITDKGLFGSVKNNIENR